jgi:hypothetical protein
MTRDRFRPGRSGYRQVTNEIFVQRLLSRQPAGTCRPGAGVATSANNERYKSLEFSRKAMRCETHMHAQTFSGFPAFDVHLQRVEMGKRIGSTPDHPGWMIGRANRGADYDRLSVTATHRSGPWPFHPQFDPRMSGVAGKPLRLVSGATKSRNTSKVPAPLKETADQCFRPGGWSITGPATTAATCWSVTATPSVPDGQPR